MKSLNPFGFLKADSPSRWFRDEAHPAVQLFYNLGFLLVIVAALSACQTTQPGIEVREVPVPTPVRCVDPADIPPEPERVSDQFNGDAKHDLGILAPNALALRVWGRTLRALIVPGCTTIPD